MSKNTTKAASAVAISMAAIMTTPAQLERLGEHLRKLRLVKSGERLEALLQQAAADELPYAEFLEQLLSEEVATKTSKNIAMRTAMARLPFVKPLETFDFDYQPSIDRKQLLALASCHFIEHGDNVIVLGPPGVGKTHLAVSLGLKAIEAGYRVLFTTAASLIEKLTKAHAEGRLEDKLKLYTAPRLLIIDEIGYLPIDRVGVRFDGYAERRRTLRIESHRRRHLASRFADDLALVLSSKGAPTLIPVVGGDQRSSVDHNLNFAIRRLSALDIEVVISTLSHFEAQLSCRGRFV